MIMIIAFTDSKVGIFKAFNQSYCKVFYDIILIHCLFYFFVVVLRFFEVLACNSVSQMYVKDRALTQILLTKPIEEYGCSMKTVMQLSENNELMQFMGTTACQTKLKSIWREHMSILTSREMV